MKSSDNVIITRKLVGLHGGAPTRQGDMPSQSDSGEREREKESLSSQRVSTGKQLDVKQIDEGYYRYPLLSTKVPVSLREISTVLVNQIQA